MSLQKNATWCKWKINSYFPTIFHEEYQQALEMTKRHGDKAARKTNGSPALLKHTIKQEVSEAGADAGHLEIRAD